MGLYLIIAWQAGSSYSISFLRQQSEYATQKTHYSQYPIPNQIRLSTLSQMLNDGRFHRFLRIRLSTNSHILSLTLHAYVQDCPYDKKKAL